MCVTERSWLAPVNLHSYFKIVGGGAGLVVSLYQRWSMIDFCIDKYIEFLIEKLLIILTNIILEKVNTVVFSDHALCCYR